MTFAHQPTGLADSQWEKGFARGAANVVFGAALSLLALIAGDLIFWNIGVFGIAVTAVAILLADFRMLVGFWEVTVPDPRGVRGRWDGLSQNIVRFTVPLGLINLDALICYFILPPPMARWEEAIIGTTAIAVLIGAIAHLHNLCKLAGHSITPIVRVATIALQAAFSCCYGFFIAVTLANALMCDALNNAPGPHIGVYTGAFRNSDDLSFYSGLATFVSALGYLFLLERISRQLVTRYPNSDLAEGSSTQTAPVRPLRKTPDASHFRLPPAISRRKPFIITIATVLVAFGLYYPHSAAAIQAHNMALARSHIPVVQKALGSDPRYANIHLSDFTAERGSLLVSGTVPSKQDIDRVKQIVASTSPPTAVVFAVIAEDEIHP